MRNSQFISPDSLRMFDAFKLTLKTEKSRVAYWNLFCDICNLCQKDFSLFTKDDFLLFYNTYEKEALDGKILYSTFYYKLSTITSIAEFAKNNKDSFNYPDSFHNYIANMEKPLYSGVFKTEKAVPLSDLDKLMSVAADTDTLIFTVIALVSKCGLTVSEIVNLKKSNMVVDANGYLGIVFMRSPANKYIRITHDVASILEQYLNGNPSSGDFIFAYKNGSPISVRNLQHRFKKVADIALPGKNATLRDLRSTAAMRMLSAGASETAVASYLGIGTKWIRRYDRAIEQFSESPVDLVNFEMKKKTNTIKVSKKEI